MAQEKQFTATSSATSLASDIDDVVPMSDLAKTTPESQNPQIDEKEYPDTLSLLAIMVAIYLALFLVALDQSIIATAIPRITDDFHSLNDIGWYGSAYLLTSASFQLVFGRIYTFYSPKWVYLASIVIFEVGSTVCGAAPNSVALIFGRAIAGIGSCGINAGNIVLITDAVPLHKRPMLTGFMGMIFGVAFVAGPLLGGVFTSDVSWRWCFYINLPLGAVTLVIVTFLLRANPPPMPSKAKTPLERLNQLDPIGTLAFFPAMVCLILALEWGGTNYAWGNAHIITLLVVFAGLMVAFVAVQMWKKELASAPPRIMAQRTILAAVIYSWCLGGALMLITYYLPIWFQAIKGVSPVKSGIMNLPVIISLVLASIVAGICVSKIGYAAPFMYAGTIFMSIGAGLLTTFTPTTDHEKWIGYQFIFGLGLGLGMQQPMVTAQAALERKDVPTGISLIKLFQTLGGAIFLAVGESVFTNSLVQNLKGEISGFNGSQLAQRIINAGATGIRNIASPQELLPVLTAYNKAITTTFSVALGLVCATIIGAVLTKWVSVKRELPKKNSKA